MHAYTRLFKSLGSVKKILLKEMNTFIDTDVMALMSNACWKLSFAITWIHYIFKKLF